jgi:hypothetical protein
MKNSLLILSTIVLTSILGACSSVQNFNGTWIKAKGESVICRDSFTFSGSDAFTVHDSVAQGGNTYSGVYKQLKGDQYQFNYGIGYNLFNIAENGNTLNVSMPGSNMVCKYNKVK